MRITTYRTELDEDLHTVLVKENSRNCTVDLLNTPWNVAKMINIVFRANSLAEEHLYMLALNNKNRPLGVFEITHGTNNMTICSPRDIFVRALLCGATSIIMVHNHPSQDTTPSQEDINVYHAVKDAGKMIGIPLIDNIIIGNGNEYYSFVENQVI